MKAGVSQEKLIARGRTADVYAWDNGQVLKLFHDWVSLESIQYEQMVAREIHARHIQSPAVGELIHIDGRTGLLYEHIEGQPMFEVILRRPWSFFKCARIFAKLHADMHASVLSAQVPTQRERLRHKLLGARALPASTQHALLEALNDLPVDDRVCHGDFHPANILMTEKGGFVIDWVDTTRGSPLIDVARTSILMLGLVHTRQFPDPWLRIASWIFHAAYLHYYFQLRPHNKNEYRRWLPVVAGARLSENIPELETWLLRQAQKI
jgi:Ser/Thr protein kinase RdoA (MazF antagonist)